MSMWHLRSRRRPNKRAAKPYCGWSRGYGYGMIWHVRNKHPGFGGSLAKTSFKSLLLPSQMRVWRHNLVDVKFMTPSWHFVSWPRRESRIHHPSGESERATHVKAKHDTQDFHAEVPASSAWQSLIKRRIVSYCFCPSICTLRLP